MVTSRSEASFCASLESGSTIASMKKAGAVSSAGILTTL